MTSSQTDTLRLDAKRLRMPAPPAGGVAAERCPAQCVASAVPARSLPAAPSGSATPHALPVSLKVCALPSRQAAPPGATPAAGNRVQCVPAASACSSDGAGRPGHGSGNGCSLVWFRPSDLRLHDHEPLTQAVAQSTSVVPVFVFDSRHFSQQRQGGQTCGFTRYGTHRAAFLHDCVSDLRDRLRQLGSDLLVRWGTPERELRSLAQLVGAASVFCHAGADAEELHLQERVSDALHSQGAELRTWWGGTLHGREELPFQVTPAGMPPSFTAFKAALVQCAVPQALPAPTRVRRLPAACPPCGDIPTMEQLCPPATQQQQQTQQTQTRAPVRGGETEALRLLASLVSGSSGVSRAHGVASLAPWLAMGCLSPRNVHHDMRRAAPAEATVAGPAAGGSTRKGEAGGGAQWAAFELMWHDFYRFLNASRATGRDGKGCLSGGQTRMTVSSVCA